MKAWIYRWLPIIFGCHCRADRSFYRKNGEKFPVCARCTGELLGILLAFICGFFFRSSLFISILLLIPMVIDGFVQLKTAYESNNRRRFVTGFLFGFGLYMLFIITSIAAFNCGKNWMK